MKFKTKLNRFAGVLAALGTALLVSGVEAADWFPAAVNSTNAKGETSRVDYQPLAKASKPWKICVSFPHLKDSFWLAADYGMTDEAKRLGVRLQVMDAGGFTQLNTQISQIENCVAGGADAVVVGAVSRDGLSNLLAELKKKNVAVVDVFNGVSSNDVGARAMTSPLHEGMNAGRYLAQKHPAGSPTVKVAWLPGPAGAGFVELFNTGFLKEIKGSAVEVLETKYGDLGKEAQSRLVEDVLQTHPNLDYVVGTAPTAEAAVPILRASKMASKVKVVSVYLTPGVYEGLRSKAIEASGAAAVVVTARIAIDQAVRLVEKKDILRDIGSIDRVYDQKNLATLKVETVFAPVGFKPLFKVGQ